VRCGPLLQQFAQIAPPMALATSLGVQHPPGNLESGTGELVALDEGDAVQKILGRLDVLTSAYR
jgi:hypothetical protein